MDTRQKISSLSDWIPDSFLAHFLNVSSRSLYNYRNGQEPHQRTRESIDRLYRETEELKKMDVYRELEEEETSLPDLLRGHGIRIDLLEEWMNQSYNSSNNSYLSKLLISKLIEQKKLWRADLSLPIKEKQIIRRLEDLHTKPDTNEKLISVQTQLKELEAIRLRKHTCKITLESINKEIPIIKKLLFGYSKPTVWDRMKDSIAEIFAEEEGSMIENKSEDLLPQLEKIHGQESHFSGQLGKYGVESKPGTDLEAAIQVYQKAAEMNNQTFQLTEKTINALISQNEIQKVEIDRLKSELEQIEKLKDLNQLLSDKCLEYQNLLEENGIKSENDFWEEIKSLDPEGYKKFESILPKVSPVHYRGSAKKTTKISDQKSEKKK